ncbi:hypothetical protein B0T25DRAFT_143002 [Lasiosphaeria hispida]|uniref:Uncharacterized protein n=1 Tax=Lasiosphaeria hispida TaxID=260671 RepID=A0AAJ0MFP7_9PEZI|nr:hypothetical protein B0T25DRAFT_143002 [Lasiosphaeria hispida]
MPRVSLAYLEGRAIEAANAAIERYYDPSIPEHMEPESGYIIPVHHSERLGDEDSSAHIPPPSHDSVRYSPASSRSRGGLNPRVPPAYEPEGGGGSESESSGYFVVESSWTDAGSVQSGGRHATQSMPGEVGAEESGSLPRQDSPLVIINIGGRYVRCFWTADLPKVGSLEIFDLYDDDDDEPISHILYTDPETSQVYACIPRTPWASHPTCPHCHPSSTPPSPHLLCPFHAHYLVEGEHLDRLEHFALLILEEAVPAAAGERPFVLEAVRRVLREGLDEWEGIQKLMEEEKQRFREEVRMEREGMRERIGG